MRPIHQAGLAGLATAVLAGFALAQAPALAPQAAPATIGSHQIDRYEAIRQLQADTRSEPNGVANWVILGELAHEVALDLPPEQDDAYYQLSQAAYERALALEPTNNGLRAAVQFAKDQAANAPTFDAGRKQGVNAYLNARRREMAANGIHPTLLVYESQANPAAAAPAAVAPANPAQVGQLHPQALPQAAPAATYRPYYNPQSQQSYGYNQYSNSYSPPAAQATQGGQAVQPTTLRQLGQQVPGVLFNEMRGGNAGQGLFPR